MPQAIFQIKINYKTVKNEIDLEILGETIKFKYEITYRHIHISFYYEGRWIDR